MSEILTTAEILSTSTVKRSAVEQGDKDRVASFNKTASCKFLY